MTKSRLLFLIILIEGYVVLACELLSIRQLIPFVGSGTEVISILISGVLLPLAVGYDVGGKALARGASIRTLLGRNILIALFILGLGLSYPVLDMFFAKLVEYGIKQRLLQTAIYALVFLVTPIFLLGQTVPLVSNYFSRRRLSEITGKMLFFSTTGSFLGSVFSTVVLMSTLGVHNTVIITMGLLALLYILVAGKKSPEGSVVCIALWLGVCALGSETSLHRYRIVSDDAYNTISVQDQPSDDISIFNINRSRSSVISTNAKNQAAYLKITAYVQYIENNFITPFVKPGAPPADILILGAGGFTIGLSDTISHYTFVDIDSSIKDVAEQKFLHQKLGPNKQFIAASARAYVHTCSQTYDLIVLDTYTNTFSIPMETITREYLLDVKKLLKPDGVLVANIVARPSFSDKFSVRYDNTFASVFPRHSREIVSGYALRTNDADHPRNWQYANVVYVYFNNPLADDNTLYTDDKNTYSIDH